MTVRGRKADAGIWHLASGIWRAHGVLTHDAGLLAGEEDDDGWAAMERVPSM